MLAMRDRLEEEPEPEEESSPASAVVPSVAQEGREYEYRTDTLTNAELVKGAKLVELLTSSGSDGWDLVDILAAGDSHVVLQRKPKEPKRDQRRVGFTFPATPGS
jgi:hypothetical protein